LEERDYEPLIEAADGLPVTVVISTASRWPRLSFKHPRRLPENVIVSVFSQRQMLRLYRDSAFTVVPVQPTLCTCGITVVLEGWAIRKAVVATGTIGLIAHTQGSSGVRFATPNSADALRRAITDLLNRPDEVALMGAAGHKYVDEHGSLDKVLQLTKGVLCEAADGRRRFRALRCR